MLDFYRSSAEDYVRLRKSRTFIDKRDMLKIVHKKAVLAQGNRAMPKLFSSVKISPTTSTTINV